MQCPHSHTIESFLNGTLDADEHVGIETHLEICTECQHELSKLATATPVPQDDTNSSPEWSPEIAERLAVGLRGATGQKEQPRADSGELRLPLQVGDYELLEVIGRGGMGTVYRARQSQLNRTVAVKMIVRQHLNPSLVDRFYVEARSAGKLDHPGIVPVYDVEQFGPYVFYAMALIPGGTLSDLVTDQQLSPQRASEMVRTIAEAIQYAHERGVIHRDLKPSNILLESDGRPKVADFGLAKQMESSTDLTASGDVLGTPGYMPPEQAGGQSGITTAADIYGLGAILYHLLTGKAPFEGDDPVAVIYRVVNEEPSSIVQRNPDVPKDLETIALHCLAKRPEDRYESAGEVARELDRFLRGEPIRVRPPGTFGRLTRWCRRYPAMAATTAAAIVALLGGAAFSTYFGLLANERSANLTVVNDNLLIAEQDARQAADDAKAKAELATQQANATLTLLESTLYELQPVLTDDAAQQHRRQQLLTSVLQGLDGLHAELLDERRVRRCRANTLLGLAEVAHQLGDDNGRTGLTASRPLFLEAIQQLQSLVHDAPDDLPAAEDLVSATTELGDILAEAGQWKEAKNYFEEALPGVRHLASQSTSDPRPQGLLAELEILYGETLMKTGQQQSAKTHLAAARQRCTNVLEQHPDNTFVRGELLHSVQLLGDWHIRHKEFVEAKACFEQMLTEAHAIVDRQPGDGAAIMDISSALERLGDLSTALKDPDSVLKHYTASLEYAEAAGRLAPDNDHVQWQLSFSYQKLADCHLRAGRNTEASVEALKCAEIRGRIAEADPTNPHLYTKLFHAQKTLATAYERDNEPAEAIKWHDQRILFAEMFAKATQTNRHAAQVKQARADILRITDKLSADN